MKITYTAPNRSHHYSYAEAINRSRNLHAFVSGFSRLSPRSKLPAIEKKLKRHDFFQTLYLASLKFSFLNSASNVFNHLSGARLDQVSYKWARESDIFIYYRTQGYNTTRRLHREGANTICVLEEVNCHVDVSHDLMEEEFKSLGLKKTFEGYSDHDLRLKAYEETDFILCPSEFVRRSFLSKGFVKEKLLKVNFGFPKIELTKEKIYTGNSFKLLYVGQLNYRKGLRYAIEAFRRLNHPKKEFIIVGPKTAVTGLENTKIPDGVRFTGVLKGDALKEQYSQASVFILPSIEEGQALVQGEALSMGLPLLITTNTGGDDLITNGVEGFIVPPRRADLLANHLQQMADDKNCLSLMSEAALQASKSLGSWDTAVEQLIFQLMNCYKNSNEY